MIGPGGLLLVVPTYMQFQLLVRLPKKKTAKLRHLILIVQCDMLSTGGDALRGCSAATTGDLGSA
jgi:hypothetical protein